MKSENHLLKLDMIRLYSDKDLLMEFANKLEQTQF